MNQRAWVQPETQSRGAVEIGSIWLDTWCP